MKKDLFLVTGASTGIGYATAVHFAQLGHQVLACARNNNDLESLSKIPNISPVSLDVTRSDQIDHAVKMVEEIRQQFEINFFGSVFLTKKFLPLLRKTQGQVINISSVSGLFAAPFLGPYAASKFAMEAFTDSLRREMFSYGVKVSSINPASINTPIWNKGLEHKKTKEALQHPVYGKALTLFEGKVKYTVQRALDVSYVINAVDQAYRQRKIRIIVAPLGVKLFMVLFRLLPTQLADKILRRF